MIGGPCLGFGIRILDDDVLVEGVTSEVSSAMEFLRIAVDEALDVGEGAVLERVGVFVVLQKGDARMQRVLLLLELHSVGEHVVPFGLLPQIVELDQLADGARPHLHR